MNVKVQSVQFDADQKLLDYVDKKVIGSIIFSDEKKRQMLNDYMHQPHLFQNIHHH